MTADDAEPADADAGSDADLGSGPDTEPTVVAEPGRTGVARYLLPRSWVGRVVVAWLAGLAVELGLGVVTGTRHPAIEFGTLVAVLAAFAIDDGLRTRR